MKKPALIIIAHGSRKNQTQKELQSLIEKLRQRQTAYQVIEYAFLELSDPSLAEVIEQLSNSSIDKISVFPYFLNSGRHVDEDIPELIDTAQKQYPDIDIELLPHFGSSTDIPDWIISMCP